MSGRVSRRQVRALGPRRRRFPKLPVPPGASAATHGPDRHRTADPIHPPSARSGAPLRTKRHPTVVGYSWGVVTYSILRLRAYRGFSLFVVKIFTKLFTIRELGWREAR